MGSGPTSTHFVNGSTAIITSVDPSGAGGLSPVKQSTAHSLKGALGLGVGNKKRGDLNLAFSCYLGKHAKAISMQSDIIPTHQY